MATTQASMNSGSVDPEEQRQTRVAWYYYVGNLTQQQIAARMGTSRASVNRLLAAGRESGVVQITINSRLSECVQLEQALVRRFGLRDAVVVPSMADDDRMREALGVGAGRYLGQAVNDGQTVAIGWGRTLIHTLRAVEGRSYRDISVVSLQGGLPRCAHLNTFEIVFDFASRLAAECYYFAAPIYADNEAARDVLLNQRGVRETYERARHADLAIMTAGDMTGSLIVEYGLRGEADAQALREAGAVGDLIGHFIDADGQPVAHELNRRTVAVQLEDLRSIAEVVLIAGGARRQAVIRAALRGGYVNTLVTDENSARALICSE